VLRVSKRVRLAAEDCGWGRGLLVVGRGLVGLWAGTMGGDEKDSGDWK
jgi:hypothetical protein